MDTIYDVTPVKVLTDEVIDKMVIHATVSELRRSIGIYPVKKVDGNRFIPTLYYICDCIDENSPWSIHALVTDISRYLLYSSIGPTPPTPPGPGPVPPLFVHTMIMWDGKTGFIDPDDWMQPLVDGGIITFCGKIKYYEGGVYDPIFDDSGNRVGVFIIPDKLMLDYYSDVKITINDEVTYGKEIFNYHLMPKLDGIPVFHYCPIITEAGEEIPITIKWDDTHYEHLIIAVAPESTLESA